MANIPLILLTNDDGIQSPGLHAAVEAVRDLGELFIVAPSRQQTGAARSYPPIHDTGLHPINLSIHGQDISAYHLDASPAQSVILGLLELANRKPALCISGVNFGENLGGITTVSGTIGAAVEAAVSGIPALAVSLETTREYYYAPSDKVDFSTAVWFTRHFAALMLKKQMPEDVDILKVDIPADATPQSSWRITRVSRQRYQFPLPLDPQKPEGGYLFDYDIQIDWQTLEPDSDIQALAGDRLVAVTPLSIDITSRTDFGALRKILIEGA
jgi:5'-nucleotidase